MTKLKADQSWAEYVQERGRLATVSRDGNPIPGRDNVRFMYEVAAIHAEILDKILRALSHLRSIDRRLESIEYHARNPRR